jgi:SNF family Na+-dependent transporter
MLAHTLSLIAKVFIVSALVSVGIKTLGPQLAIPATNSVALVFVVLPTVFLGLALGAQYRLQRR